MGVTDIPFLAGLVDFFCDVSYLIIILYNESYPWTPIKFPYRAFPHITFEICRRQEISGAKLPKNGLSALPRVVKVSCLSAASTALVASLTATSQPCPERSVRTNDVPARRQAELSDSSRWTKYSSAASSSGSTCQTVSDLTDCGQVARRRSGPGGKPLTFVQRGRLPDLRLRLRRSVPRPRWQAGEK